MIVSLTLLQNTRTEEPTTYSCCYNTSSELLKRIKMRGLKKKNCKRESTKKSVFSPLWWSLIEQHVSHGNENTQKLRSEQSKTRSAVSALNWHKPLFAYILHSIIRSRLAGNCCKHFVGRGRVCFKAEDP